MRIGKIASGAEYRMNEAFQNFSIFEILNIFPNWKNWWGLKFQTVKF